MAVREQGNCGTGVAWAFRIRNHSQESIPAKRPTTASGMTARGEKQSVRFRRANKLEPVSLSRVQSWLQVPRHIFIDGELDMLDAALQLAAVGYPLLGGISRGTSACRCQRFDKALQQQSTQATAGHEWQR